MATQRLPFTDQVAISRSEKYAAIQHIDLGDTTTTDLPTENGWFFKDLFKDFFLNNLPFAQSTLATELTRTCKQHHKERGHTMD